MRYEEVKEQYPFGMIKIIKKEETEVITTWIIILVLDVTETE